MKNFFFLCFVLLAGEASSQWSVRAYNVVRPFPNFSIKSGGGGVFFEHGRLWAASKADSQQPRNGDMAVSYDTGRTWTKVNFPTFPGSNKTIASLSFGSQNIGGIGSSAGDFYRTVDGGITWQGVGSGLKVIFLDSLRVVFTGPATSFDGGLTYKTFYPPDYIFNLGMDNLGNVFCSGVNSFYATRDSGVSWSKTSIPLDQDSWDLAAHTSCDDSVIYIANEDDKGLYTSFQPSNNLSDIYVSRDGGKSFKISYSTGPNSDVVTGTIVARRHGVAYCSIRSGIMMTTDYGDTWQHIGGPGGLLDGTSFALINDHTLVALDSLGNLWITENNGGFSLPKPKLQRPLTQGFSLTGIQSCDSASGQLSLTHVFCSPLTITGITYDAALDGNYNISLPQLPLILGDGMTLTIPIAFNPKKTVGAFPGSVHVTGFYVDDGDTMRIDTTIFFSASSNPVGPQLRRNIGFADLGSISLCGAPVDTAVILTNRGCDTLKITQGPGFLPAEFQLLTPLSLPFDLIPDSSITLRFRFFPSAIGNFACNPKFRAEQQGLVQEVEFELTGKGTPGEGIFAYEPKLFDFSMLSICGRDSGSGYITNTGCADLTLDEAKFLADGDYTTPGLPPVTVAPGDTTRYSIYLNPQQKGIRTGYILLTTTNRSGTRRDSIPLTVTITDGTRILSSSLDQIDFGKTTLCEERDTMITLSNTGCDTLIITTADLAGLGFSLDGSTLPLILLPGDSSRLPISTIVDTTGGATSNSATITFGTNADNTIPAIQLTRTFSSSSSKTYDVRLGMSDGDGTAGDFVTLQLLAGDWWMQDPVMAGVVRLDFDLTMNTDLLDYIEWSGANNVTFNGSRVTLEANPLSAPNGVLAEFTYGVHLTKDSATDILLSNLTLNNGMVLPCESKVITGTGSAFSYRYVCGDRAIQSFLRTGKAINITSIQPNPAQDEIRINFKASGNDPVFVDVLNTLGQLVGRYEGSNQSAVFSVKDYMSGLYMVTVRQGSESASAQFMVSK